MRLIAACQAGFEPTPRLPRRPVLSRLGGILAGVALSTSIVAWPVQAASDPSVAYSRETTWSVDGAPDLSAMIFTIRAVLTKVRLPYLGVDRTTVDGFFPGATYQYFQVPGRPAFYIYARDTATVLPMARYLFGLNAQRSAVEEFLRFQYPDGSISATVANDFSVDKATTTSDEETSLIIAAGEAYAASADPAWLKSLLRGETIIARLNRAMEWLLTNRVDGATGLIWRGDTTDWGDVKWEVTGDSVHLDAGDSLTASIYDQAIAYGALQSLARLNQAAGRPEAAQRWNRKAADLKTATDAALWQDASDRGFYRLHVHLNSNPMMLPFDEDSIVAIGNAAALYYGLAGAGKAPAILSALETARLAAGAPKVGLSLYPTYPNWPRGQMAPGEYQNGALWDWWAGRQITAEFAAGYSTLARQHLREVASDWASHPGVVREWERVDLTRAGVDTGYGGAAGAVGESIVRGLFGITLMGTSLELAPRLGSSSGSVRVYQAATDTYAAFRYEARPQHVTLLFGTNAREPVRVRLPRFPSGVTTAFLDGATTELAMEPGQIGKDKYLEATVATGTHRIDLVRTPRSHILFD